MGFLFFFGVLVILLFLVFVPKYSLTLLGGMSFSFVKGAILVRIEGGRCIMGRVFLIAKES